MVFDGEGQAFPNFPKQHICNVLAISQKISQMKLIFVHPEKHQRFLQVNFKTLGIKVSYKVMIPIKGMIKHSHSTESNKFTISQIRSQRWSSFFECRQTSKFLEVDIIVFDGSGQTCLKYPKQEVDNISMCYKKSAATAFLCYCDAKYSDILQGCSRDVRHYLLLLFFHNICTDCYIICMFGLMFV